MSPSVLLINFSGVFQMKILVFGDSHVTRLSSCFTDLELSFVGIGGLKATDWEKHQSILTSADVIILQLGGNDVSGHPRRANITEALGDTVRRIKDIMDFLKTQGKVGIVTSIISRRCAEVPIDLMNQRLRKKFGKRVIDFQSSGLGSYDGVHLTGNGYQQLLYKIENYCIRNNYT